MSDVNIVGDVGAQLNAQSTFSVSYMAHLTDFTRFISVVVQSLTCTHNSFVDTAYAGGV
jgi:hypothetical protein